MYPGTSRALAGTGAGGRVGGGPMTTELFSRTTAIEDSYALSSLQEGLLFHTLIARDTGTYVVHLGWTIRGDLASSMPDNLVHGSDSPESAEREIALWFGD